VKHGEGNTNSPELSLLKFLLLAYHHSHFLAATLDFTSFFMINQLSTVLLINKFTHVRKLLASIQALTRASLHIYTRSVHVAHACLHERVVFVHADMRVKDTDPMLQRVCHSTFTTRGSFVYAF